MAAGIRLMSCELCPKYQPKVGQPLVWTRVQRSANPFLKRFDPLFMSIHPDAGESTLPSIPISVHMTPAFCNPVAKAAAAAAV